MKNTAARLLLALAVAFVAACSGPKPTYIPRDPELRKLPLYIYTSTSTSARAIVFFFGNDVGFWKPHQELASYLSGEGYSVVGFDMRSFLAGLPDDPAQRESAFRTGILSLIARTRHEVGADSIPLVIFGHSLGAEVAIWTAAYVPAPNLVGVVALSPGTRSHLRVTTSDLINGPEPQGPGSFSVADAIKAIGANIRVAIVRGSNDRYRPADSALMAAGGSRSRIYIVPFAAHSLKRLILAKPIVRRAMEWVLATRN